MSTGMATTPACEGCHDTAAPRDTIIEQPKETIANKRRCPFVEEAAASRMCDHGSEVDVGLTADAPAATNPCGDVAPSSTPLSCCTLPSPAALATTCTSSAVAGTTGSAAPETAFYYSSKKTYIPAPETTFCYGSNKTFVFCGEDCKKLEREYMHPTMFDVHSSFAVHVRPDSSPAEMVVTDVASGTQETIWRRTLPRSSVSHVVFVRSGKHVLLISQSLRVNKDHHLRASGCNLVEFFDTETGHPTCLPGSTMQDIDGIASASEAFKVVLWNARGDIITFQRGRWADQYPAWRYAGAFGEEKWDEYHMHTTTPKFSEDDAMVSSCAVDPRGDWCAMNGANGVVTMLECEDNTPFWTKAWSTSFEDAKEMDVAFAAAGSLVVCHDRCDKIKVLVARSGLLVWKMQLSFPLKGPCVGAPVIVCDHKTKAGEDTSTTTTRKTEDIFSILCVGEQGQLARFEGTPDGTVVAKCLICLVNKQNLADISPSSLLVACADTNGTVTTIDARTGSTLSVRSTHANPFGIQFARSGAAAACTENKTAVRVSQTSSMFGPVQTPLC